MTNLRGVLGVIPARYSSTRFPGKPLALLAGKPMVEWVYRSARKALPRVLVATDDERIHNAVLSFGGEALLTSRRCRTGTDRVFEVAQKVKANFYVNIQGDEPLMNPLTIQKAVYLALEKKAIATAAIPMDPKQAEAPHSVKVVTDRLGRALYFSRSPIPYRAHGVFETGKLLKHLGLYVYPRQDLFAFVRFPMSPLEKMEKLEQLRALYNGQTIYVAITPYDSIGVDTPKDLKLAENLLLKRLRN